MPRRHSSTSQIQQSGGQQPQTTPCGTNRPAYDIAGRVNDLINCYLLTAGDFVRVYLPLAVIGLILVMVMLFAAYTFIKE